MARLYATSAACPEADFERYESDLAEATKGIIALSFCSEFAVVAYPALGRRARRLVSRLGRRRRTGRRMSLKRLSI